MEAAPRPDAGNTQESKASLNITLFTSKESLNGCSYDLHQADERRLLAQKGELQHIVSIGALIHCSARSYCLLIPLSITITASNMKLAQIFLVAFSALGLAQLPGLPSCAVSVGGERFLQLLH